MAFTFTVEKSGKIHIFTLSGYMEKDHGRQVRLKVEELAAQGELQFVLDFSRAPVVNSGIFQAWEKRWGSGILVCGPCQGPDGG